jgi:hypothetical protein
MYGSGEYVVVVGNTIDSLNLPSIDLCKIDVEGAELHVLNGMTATFANSPKMALLIEHSEELGGDRAAKALSLLRQRFASIGIVGGPLLGPLEKPPHFCNLWCETSR